MKVLMFGWEYPPYAAGGLATATIALARGLARLGAEVTLVVPFPTDSETESPAGVRVVSAADVAPGLHLVRLSSLLMPYASASTVAPWARRGETPTAYRHSLFADVDDYTKAAAELAAVFPHDVIHTHDWMTYAAGRAAQRISGKPFVAHIHATEFDRSGEWPNADIMGRESRGLRSASRVIANSHATKRHVVQRHGVVADHVDVVHWGIDRRSESEARGRSPFGTNVPVVLFVGRVVMQKGPDYFVDAAARVAALHDEAVFVIAGAGDMLPAMIERSIDRGIANRIFFTGGISRDDAERCYRFATVCVMPSVSEPFGIVALESLRAGTPVIISKTSGVAEAVANMITVDFWDIDDIADKVLAVITDPVLAAELRERSHEELEDLRLGPDEPARLTLKSYAAAIGMEA